MLPLNGTKTHPLSDKAKMALDSLRAGPIPRQEINAGLANRLDRSGLVEDVLLPTPYKSGRKMVVYLRLKTDNKPVILGQK